MVKGNPKSSASSATRKKHARKAVQSQPEDPGPLPKEKKPKGKEKGKKKEPRQKMYIPPVKPAPVLPDPLDTTGLAHTLPPELLVVLRSFGKKAEITKIRALEELLGSWVEKGKNEGDEILIYTLVEMLLVWLHHIPSLFLHPSRRVRVLTATLHASLLQISAVREQLFHFLREIASESQVENILGSWCMAVYDIDRLVSMTATKSWKDVIRMETESITQNQNQLSLKGGPLSSLITFVQRAALDPLAVYAHFNPVQPAAPPFSIPKKSSARSTPVRRDSDQGARPKSDEVEESEQDKKARIRCGALGAIRWVLENGPDDSKNLIPFLSNPGIWSALSPTEACAFVELESFGYAQPPVRRSAWALLQSLLRLSKEQLRPLISTLSSAVLRSAWIETDANVQSSMWQPLLMFLQDYPTCWELERRKKSGGLEFEGEESGSESESADTPLSGGDGSPAAYKEFLLFLESGCAGSPLQGYPTILIILSTIPNSILLAASPLPFGDFFTSMWMAVEGRALTSLQRSATSAAFLSAFLECIVFLLKRLLNEDPEKAKLTIHDKDAAAHQVIMEQFTKVLDVLCTSKLKVEEATASEHLIKFLISLYNVQEGLATTAWKILSDAIQKYASLNTSFVAISLNKLCKLSSGHQIFEPLSATLVLEVVKQSVEGINASIAGIDEDDLAERRITFLVNLLNCFKEYLFQRPQIDTIVDDLLTKHSFYLLQHSPVLVQTYLSYRNNEVQCSMLWHTLLSAMSRRTLKDLSFVIPILDAAESGHLPVYLKPKDNELDESIEQWITEAVSGPPEPTAISHMRKVLKASDYIISPQGLESIHRVLFATFGHLVQLSHCTDEASISTLDTLLQLFETIVEIPKQESDELDAALLNIFVLGFLVPTYWPDASIPVFQKARTLWNMWLQKSSEGHRKHVVIKLGRRLRTLVCMTETRLLPENIVKLASEHAPQLKLDLVTDILLPRNEYDELLKELSQDAIHPCLAVIDPLISSGSENEVRLAEHDTRGFSMYARAVCGLIHVFSEHRHIAKQSIWALQHVLAFMVYASDFSSFPIGYSPIFAPEALYVLDDLVTKATQIVTLLLTSNIEDIWRSRSLDALLGSSSLGSLSQFLVDAIANAAETDSSRDTRILKLVLQHIMDDVDKHEAERWVALIRKYERDAPQTSMTITSALAESAPETQRLDRYRNELAASLLGIPPSRANTEGLLSLRKLAATAPDPDSDVIFLPQHRAMNVVKSCQQWISSDEDIDEAVESAMMQLFIHLAPILQGVSGSHWEFIFDIIESNLENADITDNISLVSLARALRLIIVVQDLVLTNKSLAEDWNSRKTSILTMVRDMATVELDTTAASVPRSICRELVLTIVQDLPKSLIDQDTLPKMCHILMDPSADVQIMAYQLLHIAAKKRTEYLVIEAGVDVDSTVKIELPTELLAILQLDITLGDWENPWQERQVFGYLLSWMLVFESFQDASLRVRSSYIEQLRNLDLISKTFMPSMLTLLLLDQGIAKAFKLDMWAVDEYHIELYEPGNAFSTPLLAAHLYYRALLTVPALIHNWVLDCKDRQVSTAVTTYTSTHFSPVIVHVELAHVKSEEAMAELTNENFTIKVITSANEVVASYAVDEHQLEIRLKIPADWPLHKIEVKDVKRVGVDEHRWRAWILAVQQSIWSHNGRILDGLSLFKKNVTLHFEGQTECAICYSIISPMDGSLPKKPCRTCKNRFHAGCLYKWFNTSHSSSCPLCRSDII
ncbi:hypothetical protein AMATHDRAFT_66268, partial [Amanita thiersii Skay4041]